MKEDSDLIERELKFTLPSQDEVVLSHVRRLMPSSWRLEMTAMTEHDLYLDGQSLPLFRSGASFRLRKRSTKPGWKANYKPARTPNLEYMERREVRTALTAEEALLFRTTGIPGLAAALAIEELKAVDASHPRGERVDILSPIVLLVSYRRDYTVRPGAVLSDWTNFMDVSFDEMTAFDLRNVDVTELIRYGFLDCTTRLPSTTFQVGEAEIYAHPSKEREDAARAMMDALADALVAEGLTLMTSSKYEQAVERLDFAAPAAAVMQV